MKNENLQCKLDDEEKIKDMRPQMTKLEVNLSDHHHY